jgi:hypothetical protein
MILRRVMEHVKAQNWFAVALDFVIVVVGVFIGIQVSNWNTDQNNKRAAREYVVRIQGELAANRQDMATRTEYFSRVKNHALRALEALDKPPETLGEKFIIDSYFASLSLRRRISRATYDELLSASEINAYIDIALRQRMNEYYRAIEGSQDVFLEIPSYLEMLRSVMPYVAQAKLRSGDCTITYGFDEEGSATAILPDRCELNLTPEQTAMVVSRLVDADIGPGLTRVLADIDVKLLLFESVSTRAQNLYDYIEATK